MPLKSRQPIRAPNWCLKEHRINAGMSPNELAYRAGVSANTVRLAEKGHVPTPRVQFAIAQVFGATPLDLWPLHSYAGGHRG